MKRGLTIEAGFSQLRGTGQSVKTADPEKQGKKMKTKANVGELVAAVREFALANYENGGWDVVVEAYTDDEIAHVVGRCSSAAAAIAKMRKTVGAHKSYGDEIRSTAF